MSTLEIPELSAPRWEVGDRVAWPHRERQRGAHRRRVVRSVGTVTAVDVPGLPPGVRVEFDQPVHGETTCYATHDELECAAALDPEGAGR